VAQNKVKQNSRIEKKSKARKKRRRHKTNNRGGDRRDKEIKCPQTYLAPLNTK
jgi:hypothetical protein